MLLVDKYAPKSLDDMVLLPEIKNVLAEMVKNPVDKFRNMTLTGLPGIGKTALAKALVEQIKAECMFLNASKENNVDVIRSKVSDFCGSLSLVDQIKVVILDEADCLTVGQAGAAGAQEVLRGLIEQHQDDCRFILTCNYVNRIIPALISRCPIINVQFTPELILERLKTIIKNEHIKIKSRDFKTFYEEVVKLQFPRIRNILHAFDTCVNAEGVFNPESIEAFKTNEDEIGKFASELLKIFGSEAKGKSLAKTRQFYLDNLQIFGKDYQILAGALFSKLMDNPLAQVLMADYIYKIGQVIDPEVQFYAMLVDLKNNG